MKIMIPLINENLLAPDFGHSTFIGLYNYTDESLDLIQSEKIKKNPGYTAFFDSLSSRGVKAVLGLKFNNLSMRIFRDSDIEMYIAQSEDLLENIKFFENGLLNVYVQTVDKCGESCSSCSTSCS
jgi:predicted Fe-Mo cluster-binding NifX family protein